MEQVVYEHPISQTDLSKAIADADAAAHSQKEQNIVFALKSARNYVSGNSKNGMSCLIAAREMLKGADDGQEELAHCKAELGQQAPLSGQPETSLTSVASPSPDTRAAKVNMTEAELRQSGTPENVIAIIKEANGEVWGKNEFIAPDGAKNVLFSMATAGDSGERLIVSCAEKDRVSFWISSDKVENKNVKLTFDDAPPIAQNWFVPKQGILTPGPQQGGRLVPRLLESKALKFEYTPLGTSSPTSLNFGLLNLKELVTKNKLCKL